MQDVLIRLKEENQHLTEKVKNGGLAETVGDPAPWTSPHQVEAHQTVNSRVPGSLGNGNGQEVRGGRNQCDMKG